MGRQVNFCRVAAVTANEYARVQLFPVRRVSGKRAAKAKPTTEIQAALNQKNSERHLTDLLHLNFTPDDSAVGLDYNEYTRPGEWIEVQKILRNFICRLKRAWEKKTGKKAGEFKYIIVSERTSTGKWHHHCAFTGGMDALEIQEVWKLGRVNLRALEFEESGLCGLAHYIQKSRTSYRRWSASKNLTQPVQKTSDHRLTNRDLRYINEHPEDVGFIEELFHGWKVAPRGVEVLAVQEKEAEEGHEVPILPFVTIQLYREDCPYFTRYPSGSITYHHHREWRKNYATV